MSDEKIEMRVLNRAGARIITQEEIAKITGGQDGGHLPTSSISRDHTGRPVDITQD